MPGARGQGVCDGVVKPYVGPPSFIASLYSQQRTGHHGKATFRQGATIISYMLTLSPGIDVAEAHIILFHPLASIAQQFAEDPFDNIIADLVKGEGKIKNVVPGSPCNFQGLLQEMAAGHARVVVLTTGGEHIEGQIEIQK